MKNELEALVRSHPAAASVRVAQAADGWRVEVVLRPLDDDGIKRVSRWELLWQRSYGALGRAGDPTLDDELWKSRHTGRPYTDEEHREWLAHTVEAVRALRPRRVLELGCGSGHVMKQLAPACEHWMATDFSAAVIDFLRQDAPPNVQLEQRAAHELDGLPPFDTVVINSVIQYFPSLAYLDQLIARLIDALPDGGAIFAGDVRSLPLQRALQASVELHRAAPGATRAAVKARVDAGVEQEGELLLDPACFTRPRPRVAEAWVQLERGRHATEMSCFRYDAILRAGAPAAPRTDEAAWTRDLSNRRLTGAAQALAFVDGSDDTTSAAQARAAIAPSGIDPDDLFAQGLEVTWAASGAIDRMDALRRDPSAPRPIHGRAAPARLANDPLRATVLRRVRPELERLIRSRIAEQPLDLVIT